MLPFILIAHDLPKDWLALLDGQVDALTGPKDTSGFSSELLERLPEAEGIFTLLVDRVDEELLAQATRLRVVSNMAVGVDNVDLPAATARKIPVGNTPGVLTDATADMTFALMLAAARRIVEGERYVRDGNWRTWGPQLLLGADFVSATWGLIGFGRIGQAVARRARGFDLRVIYHDPAASPAFGALPVSLDELLRESDFISVHVPLTTKTRHLINEQTLSQMKPGAVLVNTSRGPVIDPKALYAALKSHRIFAAALDVTEPEPLPPDDPLLELPNCLVVPHLGSASKRTRDLMAYMSAQNLLAGLKGERLPNCANPEVYG